MSSVFTRAPQRRHFRVKIKSLKFDSAQSRCCFRPDRSGINYFVPPGFFVLLRNLLEKEEEEEEEERKKRKFRLFLLSKVVPSIPGEGLS